VPLGARGSPVLIKESTPSGGSAQQPQISIGHGEHGPESAVNLVTHSGRFVDDHQPHGRKSSQGILISGQSDHSGAVGKKETGFVPAIAPGRNSQLAEPGLYLLDKLGALPLARAGYDDETSRNGAGVVNRFDPGNGGLAPLPAAIQDSALCGAPQHFHLQGVSVERQAGSSKLRSGVFRGSRRAAFRLRAPKALQKDAVRDQTIPIYLSKRVFKCVPDFDSFMHWLQFAGSNAYNSPLAQVSCWAVGYSGNTIYVVENTRPAICCIFIFGGG
jgi:hypothetical protein